MKTKIIIGLILLLPVFGFSQGEFNNWYFGGGAAISFNSGTPQVLPSSPMNAVRACISVSDSLGNLLFYSNGLRVWNRNHQVMPNGDSIHASIADQTVNVIQKIDDDSCYYLFTMALEYIPHLSPYNGLHYSVINMRLDSGLGDIEPGQKEIPLQTMYDIPGLMTTARHQNNKDAWVIVRMGYNTNHFAAFLVNESGISTTPVVSPGSFLWNIYPYGNPGTMRVSPDGTKLVYPYWDTVEVCNFNATTGYVTSLFLLEHEPMNNSEWGYLEFSLDSKYLYRSSGDWPWTPSYIYQYDARLTDSAEFAASSIVVGYRNRGVHLQRGPDGKIYGGEAGKDSLSVIHSPNLQGTACNYEPYAIGLNGSICHNGMPDLLQRYYLYVTHIGQCLGNPIEFLPNTWPPADSVHWDFGDPGSGSSNFSNLLNPTHIYSSPGIYNVQLYVRHNDKRTDTASIIININPGVSIDAGPDRSICQGDSVTFIASGCNNCAYQWSNLSTGQMNIGTNQSLTTDSAGIYMVTGTGTNDCYDHDTVELTVDSIPEITINPLSTTICSGESTNIPLTSNVPNTNFSWTAIGSSPLVTGFSPGSGDTIDQILTNNGAAPETVTYTITPSIGTCQGDSVQYVVTVTPGDSVMISISSSADSVCEGTPVTFTGAAMNGGSTPVYQWQVNGINAGINNAVFMYTPVDGDVVSCILTSNAECITNNPATSNSITMSVVEAPLVTFTTCFDTTTTINAKPYKLKGGIPLGGIYSGPGVDQFTGYFNPAIAGVGIHLIEYRYINFASCSDVRYRVLDVRSASPFSCGNNLIDIRDDQIYPTVQIGSQCWMTTNLNYGTEILYTTPQRDNCIPEKYKSAVGSWQLAVYQWDELMRYEDTEQIQGLCPPGWHVPSETDWNTLFANWTNNAFAGAPLKYSGYSGFNALLSGAELFNKGWEFDGFATFFWSSTSHGQIKAWAHGMNDYNFSVSYYPSYRANAFSVRCVRD